MPLLPLLRSLPLLSARIYSSRRVYAARSGEATAAGDGCCVRVDGPQIVPCGDSDLTAGAPIKAEGGKHQRGAAAAPAAATRCFPLRCSFTPRTFLGCFPRASAPEPLAKQTPALLQLRRCSSALPITPTPVSAAGNQQPFSCCESLLHTPAPLACPA